MKVLWMLEVGYLELRIHLECIVIIIECLFASNFSEEANKGLQFLQLTNKEQLTIDTHIEIVYKMF